MLAPKVEFLDERDAVPRPPVKKQVWNGERFVPITIYKIKGFVGVVQENWLQKTFGHPGTYRDGTYWDYNRAGDFTLMDEKVYMFYKLKWGSK